jgi:ubiquitin carboxyl-terminal hydrolase 14
VVLSSFSHDNNSQTQSAPSPLLRDLGNLFKEMSDVDMQRVVVPGVFVHSFRTTFPQFAEQDKPGMYQQQDAEEVWSILLEALSASLPAPEGSSKRNLIHELFGCDMHEIYTNTELDGEIKEMESMSLKVPINIRRDTVDISFAFNGGIDDGTVEKYSALLERDAVFQKKTFMTRIPPYLVVQMVRFEWRKDIAKRAKILKEVKFPVVLDLVPACMESFSETLMANRRRVEEDPSLKIDTGLYELCAVITHKGRYAHAGHYMSWVKQDDGMWLCFDDDATFVAPVDDIPHLGGGGDWSMAYILLYRNRRASGDAVMKGK